MKRIVILSLYVTLGFVMVAGFLACKSEEEELTGTLTIQMTDSPFPAELVSEANVTIGQIEIRRSDEMEENPFVTLSEETRNYNLLKLRNGVVADLVAVDVPVGEYDLIRLYVEESSITLIDNTIHDLTIPSGAQTGIKIFIRPSIEVEGGLTSELLLDFDVTKSFVVQGNIDTPAGIKGFLFKPVIRAINLSTSGRIIGSVTDTTNTSLDDATVWVESDSVVTSTFTDSTGNYTLIGIPQGTYTAKATKVDYDTVSVSGAEVIAANETLVDFQLTPQ